ncbi:MAG: hypothetical protein RLW62_11275, partial [Gammaproteobacteria bacterium]
MPVKALNSLPPVALVRAAVVAPRWQLGQLLSAEVIGTGSQNYTQLRIGDAVVNARTALPLREGQQLALTVTATTPEVVLKPLARPAEPPLAAALSRGLARALPRQGSAEDTLTLLRDLSRASDPREPATAPRLPAALAARITAFLQQLPEQATLATPARLRAVLEQAAQPGERQLRDGDARQPASAVTPRGPLVELGRLRRQLATLPLPTATGQSPAPTPAAATPGPARSDAVTP